MGLMVTASGCSGPEKQDTGAAEPAFSVFSAVAGSDEETEAVPMRGSSDAQDPVVDKVTLEPAVPKSRMRMRAHAEVSGTWTSLEYRWRINGQNYGGSSIEIVLPMIETGDTVEVGVVPIRGLVRGKEVTASVAANNQPPRMLGIDIEYAEPSRNRASGGPDGWRAVPHAEDPDGDSVEFEYRWLVNGVASRVDEEEFAADDLVRGDRLSVEVRAFDGRAWSLPTRSGEIEIGNVPPAIVSTPPRVDAAGHFRYKIEVEDADGDSKFHFALRNAPRGMRIDDVNGIVRWEPDTDQAGRHDVEIVVTDEGGAESTQSFSLALISRSDADAVVPASPR